MNRLCLIAALAVILAGCANKEVLVRRSADVSAGVDLTGQWQLSSESAGTNERIADAELAAAGGRGDILQLPRSGRTESGRGRKPGSLVHVFLETGSNLKITQTTTALFISFDRAIVEEYLFGEYAQVSVGSVVAWRSSGWEEGAYVIETLDDEGIRLHERYQLERDGMLLTREVSIWRKDVLQLSLVQKFDRANR